MLPKAPNAAVACTEIRTPIRSPDLKEAVWFISEHWAALSRSLSSLSTFAFAQGTADIVGRVTDTSGAVLPAVTVTAENIATKNVRTTISGDTGDYVFTLLPIGTYTVRIELQGFQTVNVARRARNRRSRAR